MINIKIDVAEVHIDTRGMHDKVMNDPAFWLYAAIEWRKLYDAYVPMRTGMLKDTIRIRSKEIDHYAPYAHRIYEGTGMRFRKDMHPHASAQWDKKAAPTQLPKLATALQAYVDSGRLKLE